MPVKFADAAPSAPRASAGDPLDAARAYVAGVEGHPRRVFVRKFAEELGRLVSVEGLERSRLPRWIVDLLKTRLSRAMPRTTLHAARPAGHGGPRALIVSRDLTASGAPKIVVEVADILIAAGWRVLVLSSTDGPFRDRLVEAGAHVLICDTAMVRDSTAIAALVGVSDLAICNTIVSFEAVRSLTGKVRTHWYLHEISLLVDLLEKQADLADVITMADAVWTGSEASAAIVRRYRSTVRVLPYGLEPIRPADAGTAIHRGVTVIGLLGSIEPRKGQDLAVAAWRDLSAADRGSVRLMLHGRVLEKDFACELGESAADLPGVTIGGELDEATYRATLLDCDAVLIASRDDTLPLVSLDALGAGKVLLCTPTTGTSAYLVDGVNGFVAPTADARGIATMLAAALARRSEWPSIGAAGRALFDEVFSKAAFAQRVLDEVGRPPGP